MNIRTILAGMVGVVLVTAMPALAVVKVAKYTGTISSGYDTTGVFGAPNTDLGGAAYVATYTYDKTLAGVTISDGVSYENSYGGAAFAYPGMTPIIISTITIHGVTRSAFGSWGGYIYTSTEPFVQHQATDDSIDAIEAVRIYGSIGNRNTPVGAPWSLDQNMGTMAATGGYGFAKFFTFGYTTGLYTELAEVSLGSDAIYSVSSVPEPESWALMIAGFGLVGGTMRRRSYSLAA